MLLMGKLIISMAMASIAFCKPLPEGNGMKHQLQVFVDFTSNGGFMGRENQIKQWDISTDSSCPFGGSIRGYNPGYTLW